MVYFYTGIGEFRYKFSSGRFGNAVFENTSTVVSEIEIIKKQGPVKGLFEMAKR